MTTAHPPPRLRHEALLIQTRRPVAFCVVEIQPSCASPKAALAVLVRDDFDSFELACRHADMLNAANENPYVRYEAGMRYEGE